MPSPNSEAPRTRNIKHASHLALYSTHQPSTGEHDCLSARFPPGHTELLLQRHCHFFSRMAASLFHDRHGVHPCQHNSIGSGLQQSREALCSSIEKSLAAVGSALCGGYVCPPQRGRYTHSGEACEREGVYNVSLPVLLQSRHSNFTVQNRKTVGSAPFYNISSLSHTQPTRDTKARNSPTLCISSPSASRCSPRSPPPNSTS
jgi:hypothetical protein